VINNKEFKEEFLESVKQEVQDAELLKFLKLIRTPIVKLSETSIIKSDYNAWKRSGVLESMFKKNEKKEWQVFSITQLIILCIVDNLVLRNIDTHIIRKIVDDLLKNAAIDDLESFYWFWKGKEIEAEESGEALDIDAEFLKLKNKLDLMTYFTQQKQNNPEMPLMSEIESFVIGILRTKRPYYIFINEDNNIRYFTTDIFIDTYRTDELFDILSQNTTVINIGFIIDRIFDIEEKSTNEIFKSGKKLEEIVIEKGYDFLLLKKTRPDDETYKFVDEDLTNTDMKTEKLIHQYANQDILFRIRDSKKVNIQRRFKTKK
jgi:hypothetical protein